MAFTDGCFGDCAMKENPQPEDSRSRRGVMCFMTSGPSLYADVDVLANPF